MSATAPPSIATEAPSASPAAPPSLSPPSTDDIDRNTSTARLSPQQPLPPLSPASKTLYGPLRSQLASLQSDLVSELEEELSQPTKVDAGGVKDICRYFQSEYIKVADKWLTRQRDKAATAVIPDALLVEVPLLPPEWRVRIWKILLACHNKDESLIRNHVATNPLPPLPASYLPSPSDGADNGEQGDDGIEMLASPRRRRSEKNGHQTEHIEQAKLIHRDVCRTRVGVTRIKPEYRQHLSLLLDIYCRSRGVEYKQGLNELLLPLLVLCEESQDATLDTCYNLFYALIHRFLPSIFSHSDFESLRCLFRAFRLLLLYFDPQLGTHVDRSGILPELYATAWFITLFARDCPLELLWCVWDFYLVEDDPHLHYFVALALLMQERERLLSLDGGQLPVALRRLHLSNLLPLLSTARTLRQQTPPSLLNHLHVLSSPSSTAQVLEMRATYDSLLPAICVPTAELVQQAHSDVSVSGGVKYLLLDVREKRQWENGHIATAVHINPCVLFEPNRVAQLMRDYQHLNGQHISILGNEMRSYRHLADIAQATVDKSADTGAAQPLLDAFLAAIRETSMAEVEEHKAYLTPKELMLMEREDKRREEARKWRLGAGAAPPVAAVITKEKGSSRSPSPAQPIPAVIAPPSVPDSPAATTSSPPTPATSSVVDTSAADAASSDPPPSPAPTSEPPAAEVVYSFPATSPLMDPYTASFVHLFLSNGFTHVSVCEGGYHACHELVMSYKKQQEQQKKAAAAVPPAGASATAATPAAASAAATAPAQTIELVDHTPVNCLCCSPHLYDMWRANKQRQQQEAQKKAEREKQVAEKKAQQDKVAAEKEKERAAKAEQDRKAKEEAEKGRQRRREAGEVVDEPVDTAAVAHAAADKLNSWKKWLSDKGKTSASGTSTSGEASPAPGAGDSVGGAGADKKQPVAADGSVLTPPVAAAVAVPAQPLKPVPHLSSSSTAASSASSYFSKFKSEAQAFAKKLAEPAPAAAAAQRQPPPPIDLRVWQAEGAIALFNAHEVRRVAGSTQGLLLPRVLAVSDEYVMALRLDIGAKGTKEKEVKAKEVSGVGWLDSVVKAVSSNVAHVATAVNTAVASDGAAPKTAQPVAASAGSAASANASSVPASPSSAAFSLAPAEDSLESGDTPADSAPETPTASSAPDIGASTTTDSVSAATTSSASATTAEVAAPIVPPSPSSLSLSKATNAPFTLTTATHGILTVRRPLTQLERITSKKERPAVLTFHWRVEPSSQQPAQTMYVLDRPKECIEVVKKRYTAAKLKKRQEEEDEDEDEDDEVEEGSKDASEASVEAKEAKTEDSEAEAEQVNQPVAAAEVKSDEPAAAAVVASTIPDL